MQTLKEWAKRKIKIALEENEYETYGHKTLKNDLFSAGRSEISTVWIFPTSTKDPQYSQLNIFYKRKESDEYISMNLVGIQIIAFYEKCLAEALKKIAKQDPCYILSQDILDNIRQSYNFLFANRKIFFENLVTQEDVNDLFEKYYKKIAETIDVYKTDKPVTKSHESDVVVLGEAHYSSLLQDLIVFEIIRDTNRFKNLYIEQNAKGFYNFVERRKEYPDLSHDSFSYLPRIAKWCHIAVFPVESTLARKLTGINFDLARPPRDYNISKNILNNLPPNGIGVLLCGANHIPGISRRLRESKACNVLELDVDDFQIYSEMGRYKRIKHLALWDASEIHAMVLEAQSQHRKKHQVQGTHPQELSSVQEEKKIGPPSRVGSSETLTSFFVSSSPALSDAFETNVLKNRLKLVFAESIPTTSMFLKDYLILKQNEIASLPSISSAQQWLADFNEVLLTNAQEKIFPGSDVQKMMENLSQFVKTDEGCRATPKPPAGSDGMKQSF